MEVQYESTFESTKVPSYESTFVQDIYFRKYEVLPEVLSYGSTFVRKYESTKVLSKVFYEDSVQRCTKVPLKINNVSYVLKYTYVYFRKYESTFESTFVRKYESISEVRYFRSS